MNTPVSKPDPSEKPYSYQGGELDTFADAVNWKRYLASQLEPYLSGNVLEVGAGIGGMTAFLARERTESWICLEPDSSMADRIEDLPLNPPVEVKRGTIEVLPPEPAFSTILYIDVLEHIDDDALELEKAASRLVGGGSVVVLSPAHQWLYSPFDEAIGHYRRYTRADLERIAPSGTTVSSVRYLESAGILASLGNKLLLRSAHPTYKQMKFWDRFLVPVSRRIDPLLRYRLGKSLLIVYERRE